MHQPKANEPIGLPPKHEYGGYHLLTSDQAAAYKAKCLYENLIEEFDEETAKSLLTAAMPEIYKAANTGSRMGVPVDYKPRSLGTKKRGDNN
ncbi:hypothetical protein [Paenibacillus glucanolyticus]|uniref:hypothetical protein n=1 Tax=Paenibacillus glucanolyticus TaxID=59843 RepID=UPI0030D26949